MVHVEQTVCASTPRMEMLVAHATQAIPDQLAPFKTVRILIQLETVCKKVNKLLCFEKAVMLIRV
jgi:hypothetical protein